MADEGSGPFICLIGICILCYASFIYVLYRRAVDPACNDFKVSRRYHVDNRSNNKQLKHSLTTAIYLSLLLVCTVSYQNRYWSMTSASPPLTRAGEVDACSSTGGSAASYWSSLLLLNRLLWAFSCNSGSTRSGTSLVSVSILPSVLISASVSYRGNQIIQGKRMRWVLLVRCASTLIQNTPPLL